MSYKKFDDPSLAVSQAARKVYDATFDDKLRRALQGVLNRVIWGGTGGTHATATIAGVGTGGSGGVKIANTLAVVINGRYGTISTQADLELPSGTQASATYVKYLISAGFGSSGTVTAGNEGSSATAARLPDCPDGHVALGYVEYAANGTRGFIRTNGTLSGNTGGTNGTVNEWVNLIHMPVSEN